MPSAAAFLARNLCGICTRMPAPSPARGSAPTAPRCSKLTRMVKASATILCDLRPLMSAINPTPQESFSSAGSNRPKPDASIVVLAILPEPRPTRPQGPDAATVKLLSRHRPHAEDGTKRACAQGRATLSGGNLCAAGAAALVACFAARRALATDGRPGVFPLLNRGGARLGHQLGQQCCPIQNMANSATQYKRPTLSCALRLRVEKKRDEQALRGPRSPRFLRTFRCAIGSWDGLWRN